MAADRLSFGRFEIRAAERQLLRDGAPVALGTRAFDVLLALAGRPGRLVTKNELLDIVWPGLVVEDNNLQVQVSTLRRILGRDAIATVPGRGYQFTLRADGREAAVDSTAEPADEVRSPTNLPPRLPPIYGRAEIIGEITRLLPEHRLISVVGAPGIGKTRLAQAVAFNMLGAWPDGVWIVELVGANDAAAVHSAVSSVVGIALDARRTPEVALIEGLRKRSLLLVLDNCEHLVDAVAALVRTLLTQTAGVHVLITSQAPLRLPEERIHRLDGLSLPTAADSAAAAESGAVTLFAVRATAAMPGFQLGPGNLALVAEICRRLDGIPLALELAAARLPMLGLDGLARLLGDRFRTLTAGSRVALARHQTLRSALDWSHGLLSADEQTVFRRLGVFAGGFDLELAQAVAADGALDAWAVIEHLASLIDRSLVVAGGESTPRYRLLETMRAYALEELERHGERDALQRRHAVAMSELFMRMDADWYEHRPDELRRRHARELDNVRAADDWSVGAADGAAIAAALAADAAEIWLSTGLAFEGLTRWQRAQWFVENAPAEIQLRYWLAGTGYLRWSSAGRDAGRRAIALARRLQDDRRLYVALAFEASGAAHRGDEAGAGEALRELDELENPGWPMRLRLHGLEARAHTTYMSGRCEETMSIAHRIAAALGGSGDSRGEFRARLYVGNVMFTLGRHREAVAQGRELRDAPGASRHDLYGMAVMNLVEALLFAGETDEAEQTARRLVALRGPPLDGLGLCLGLLLAQRGRFEDAARLIGFGEAAYAREALPLEAAEVKVVARAKALLSAAMSETDFERLAAEGATLDEAAMLALSRLI